MTGVDRVNVTYVGLHIVKHVQEGSSAVCPKIPFCALSASRRPFVDKQENLNPRCVSRLLCSMCGIRLRSGVSLGESWGRH